MESWIVWLVLAALLGLAEVLTTTLAFGLLAVAAVVAAVVGGVGLGLPFQIAAFVRRGRAGLGVVRPLAVRHIRQPPAAEDRDVRPGRAVRRGDPGSHGARRAGPHRRRGLVGALLR